MKANGYNADILAKIEKIEKELSNLKIIIFKKLAPTRRKTISLKGILRGVKITDSDVARAKKSLYSKLRA